MLYAVRSAITAAIAELLFYTTCPRTAWRYKCLSAFIRRKKRKF